MVLKHIHYYKEFKIEVSPFNGDQVRLWIGGEDTDPHGSIDFNPNKARELAKSLIEIANHIEGVIIPPPPKRPRSHSPRRTGTYRYMGNVGGFPH